MTIRIDGTNTTANPGITGADADTGLQFGTDEVKIVTGGTDAVTVDSSQRVGIGTATVDEHLHIEGTGTQRVKIEATDTSVSGLVMMNTNRRYDVQVNGSDLQFYDNTASTERMRLDSDGALGIGVVAPARSPLHLHQPSGSNTYLKLTNGNTGAAASNGTDLTVLTNGEFVINQRESQAIAAFIGGTERMRITSGGYFKASNFGGYASPTASYHEFNNSTANFYTTYFRNTSSNPYGMLLYFDSASPDNNSNTFIVATDSTANRFIVYSDGDAWTSDAGTLTSDATLKRDITDASPKLADVMNLRVRNFYWQEDYHPNKQDKKLIGFIAQEFEEVFPGLVSEHKIKGGEPVLDENGNETGEKTPEVFKKGIKEAKLVPILVKALQEAVERIETLETQNAEQATTIASFEARISALEGGN